MSEKHVSVIENVGWTLGNDCPYRCPQCYSSIIRNRGRNLTISDVERIVSQLRLAGVKTVNLGGNEPIFTGGPNPRNTVLPDIIRSLHEARIVVGLTTAGITLTHLERLFPDVIPLLNDVDVSLDSPFSEEHNKNRGGKLYNLALNAIDICRKCEIDRTIVMCGMNWNLSDRHIDGLIDLAREHQALVRINFMKPTEPQHMNLVPDVDTFYRACHRLLAKCKVVEMGEPLVSTMAGETSRGCPCGTKSFRINSITPEGRIPVSPCVYAHDYRVGNLLEDDLADIVDSPQFEAFRERRYNPSSIKECEECQYLEQCRGGCASRAYLWSKFKGTGGSIENTRDPYCLRDFGGCGQCAKPEKVKGDAILVHRDYLCTIIVNPM